MELESGDLTQANTLIFELEDGSLYFLLVSSPPVVDAILELADLQPGETMYDLGSGDGRVIISAAQKFSIRAVGIESNKNLFELSELRIRKAGLEERVQVELSDFNVRDLSPADVIVFFLGPDDVCASLKARLQERVSAGARLITINCPLSGWRASRQLEIISDLGYTVRLYDQKGCI